MSTSSPRRQLLELNMYTEHAEELCCASAIRTALLLMMRTTKIARKIACTLRGIYAAAHHHARLLVCQLGESTGRAAVSSSAGPWTWLWMTCWTSPLLTPSNAAIPRCASNCFGVSLLQCARMIVRARTAGVNWRMHALCSLFALCRFHDHGDQSHLLHSSVACVIELRMQGAVHDIH